MNPGPRVGALRGNRLPLRRHGLHDLLYHGCGNPSEHSEAEVLEGGGLWKISKKSYKTLKGAGISTTCCRLAKD